MSEYLTGVQGFSDFNYYVGRDGTLVGAPSFTAACLFSTHKEGAAQTVWANRDGANNGWEIRVTPGTGAITIEINTTAGLVSISATPDTPYFYVPVLVLLHFTQPSFALFINGNNVGAAAIAGAFLPAIGTAPTVGVRNSAGPSNGAESVVVHGVAYTEPAAVVGAGAGPFYLACREAKDLVGLDDLDPATDFVNRWSAKRHNFQPGPVGVPTWAPDAGNQNLTRVGTPSIRGFKDLDWHYSFETVTIVNP